MTAINVHLAPLPEGEVISSCTKELDNLRLSDLEDAVIEDPEPGSAEEYDRAAAIAARKEAAKTGRRKKKKTASSTSLASNTFQELQADWRGAGPRGLCYRADVCQHLH